MRLLLLAALLMATVMVAGCGSDSDEDSGADQGGAPGASQRAPAAESKSQQKASADREAGPAKARQGSGTTIKLAGSQYGEVLFDRRGQAIYLFAKEKSARSECYGACAAAWPPVLTQGGPQAGGGIDQSLLGTTKRKDGKTQVTYNGHPLYFYAHEGRNEVRCHNVSEFGGLWLVLDRNGDALG